LGSKKDGRLSRRLKPSKKVRSNVLVGECEKPVVLGQGIRNVTSATRVRFSIGQKKIRLDRVPGLKEKRGRGGYLEGEIK